MIDETRQVLEMVANGTVTPDQGAELLDAMDDRPTQPTFVHSRPAPGRKRDHERHRERGHRRERNREISDPALAELARAAMHGVDAEYVRSMHEFGFADFSLADLTELAIHGVDREFVEEMGNLGFTDLTADELIQLSISGIDEEFLREMGELGYLKPSVAEAIRLRESREAEPVQEEPR